VGILEKINSPKDLKNLSLEELRQLSQEIREYILGNVSKTGGHLAASLGAVEIAVGLHYILDCPKDTIIWDVGHQAYAHKILTGRREEFKTLRQLGGLSGFPNKDESTYDRFTTGHGSTSISLGLGLACARDIAKGNEKIVVVIGDGSLAGGMALEALNHAGHIAKDILVILNDNEFSISPSVGAFSKYLNRLITNSFYNRAHKKLQNLVKRLPRIGGAIYELARRFEEGLKHLIVPGAVFEELGLRYFGPIDGHDLRTLIPTLKKIVDFDGPKLVHVVTKKGKGFSFAELNPDKFHGISSFNIETGEPKQQAGDRITYTQAFSNALVELAKKDKRIVAITAAMPDGTGLDAFAAEFPDRFFNVGMAEEHAVTFAAGLAEGGLKPVVAIYSTFMQRSYDQLMHDVCLQNSDVLFVLDRAGIVGEDGPTHHGLFDIAYLRHMPGMVMLAPKDEFELKHMLEFAVDHKGPCALRYPRGFSNRPTDAYSCPLCNQKVDLYGVSHEHKNGFLSSDIELGKAEVLRQGKDAAIFALGSMAWASLEAAELLSKENIDVAVINARFVKPIDEALIEKLSKDINKFITVEEGVLEGGFGSFLLETLEKKGIKNVEVHRIGLPSEFITHGKREVLLDLYGLSSIKIAKAMKEKITKGQGAKWQK